MKNKRGFNKKRKIEKIELFRINKTQLLVTSNSVNIRIKNYKEIFLQHLVFINYNVYQLSKFSMLLPHIFESDSLIGNIATAHKLQTKLFGKCFLQYFKMK